MDYAKFEARIKELGVKIGFLSTLAYVNVAALIAEDEIIQAATASLTTKGSGCLVVTNSNFYASVATGMFASDKVVIDISKISGCKISGAFGDILTITEGTTKYEYKGVKNPKNIMDAIKAKNDNPAEQSKKEESAAADPTEELRKYKKLLDDGIITQEDFDQKKKVLLGL